MVNTRVVITSADTCQVAIVGGGPVGLLLGCMLRDRGVEAIVLERGRAPAEHSRAIGIHPPALELLARVGVAEAMIERGVVVRSGAAYGGPRRLGRLSFDSCPPPYRFVLSLPQQITEQLLERRLRELGPRAEVMRRGVEVTELHHDGDGVEVLHRAAGAPARSLRAGYVVGCDGRQSVVRQQLQIPLDGGPYPDTFLMGDFDDNTPHGPEAVIHLHPAGLVECFPLPGGRRRWVAMTDRYHDHPTRRDLERIVADRVGHDLRPVSSHMISPFRVQHLLARQLVAGRALLAGDAAHVVTPIGGQGMNLGWLNAWRLGQALEAIVHRGADPAETLAGYERAARDTARRVIRRGALNMRLGRPGPLAPLRDGVIRTLLGLPAASRWLANTFTMRGLA